MRLIDADQFGVVSFQGKSEDFIEGVCFILDKIYEAPTVEAYTFEQVQDLVALNKKMSEERPHGEWRVHSHCSDGFSYKCSLCGRVVNQGYWFKQKEILSVYPYCHCGAEMVAVENPFKWYFSLGKSDDVTDMKHIKVGDTIYTQDDDKQGWTGREVK